MPVITNVVALRLPDPLLLDLSQDAMVTLQGTANSGRYESDAGTLTYPDENGDGVINRGETINHDSRDIVNRVDPIPDLNNAPVLGVGTASGTLTNGTVVSYRVIWVSQGGTQYLLFPGTAPGDVRKLMDGGTVRLTFLREDNILPPDPPCFTAGTMILTDRGEVAVETLQPGDLVMTRDHGLQPLRWIGGARLDAIDLAQRPRLRPIRIRAGALGAASPAADLLVSPQHRVLVRSVIARKMFGTLEVLVAAKQLVLLDGVDVADDVDAVQYIHMLFDRHEIVVSNGAETESLFTGPEAMRGVGEAARAEIAALFPVLLQDGFRPQAARPLVSGRMGRKMAQRHHQNRKALIA